MGRLLGGQRLETGIGEQRSVAMADGSLLRLNTDTAIDLAADGGRQLATLIRGEVMFDLARAAARPLTVRVGGAVLEALGGAFDLDLRDSLAQLLVERGAVTVRGEGGVHRVAAGSSAAIGDGAVAVTPLTPAVVGQRLAWRRGVIDLDGQSLAQAAAEFNRYLKHPIVVADPSLASIRLGGTFATDESGAFVDALQRSFAISVVRSDDGSILLTAASCAPGDPPRPGCAGDRPR